MGKREKGQIKQVLSVLLSAVLCAALLAAWMIYRYGPSGQYVAGNTILAPDVMEKINYKDKHPLTGKGSSFVFNSIEFSYFDNIDKRQLTRKVNLETCEKFYKQVALEKSLRDVSDQVKGLFAQAPAALAIIMQTEMGVSQTTTKVFQLIQFTDTDYFRVQLRKETGAEEWAYFYRPAIYQEALRLFTVDNS